jgi:SAM-dependent methyltransferase
MTMLIEDRPAWVARQRATYAQRYRVFRHLYDLLRYDLRHRLLVMEELFRRFDIPFERQRVYELGFGTGAMLFRFDVSSTLHGAELSDGAVRALREDPRTASYAGSAIVACDRDGRPAFPARDYDVIIASHVLEHVPDDLEVLRAFAAHLAHDGHVLVFLPLERPRHNPDHARVYTRAGFVRRLREAGLEPVHVEENFRYASHFVQIVNWPSRARLPVVGTAVEVLKTLLLALPPSFVVRALEAPLARLHVTPTQLVVLARRAADPR